MQGVIEHAALEVDVLALIEDFAKSLDAAPDPWLVEGPVVRREGEELEDVTGRAERFSEIARPTGAMQVGDRIGAVGILILPGTFDRIGNQRLGVGPQTP